MNNYNEFDNEFEEQQWLEEQLEEISEYFEEEGIIPPVEYDLEISLPPYLSLWSATAPEEDQQLWVINGDCPTDYVVTEAIIGARDALLLFHKHWTEISTYMKRGEQHPTSKIGDPNNVEELQELGDLLERRANVLQEFAYTEELWGE